MFTLPNTETDTGTETDKDTNKQDSIPVGCVLLTCRPYLVVSQVPVFGEGEGGEWVGTVVDPGYCPEVPCLGCGGGGGHRPTPNIPTLLDIPTPGHTYPKHTHP